MVGSDFGIVGGNRKGLLKSCIVPDIGFWSPM